jgi:hypothetical protein
MRLHTYFLSLFLAGMLLGNPATGLADDNFPAPMMNSDTRAVEERAPAPTNQPTQQEDTARSFEIAAVDYCYRGSTLDPATGETIDLYVLCTGDSIESNLDLA